jgi:hypothetical protein
MSTEKRLALPAIMKTPARHIGDWKVSDSADTLQIMELNQNRYFLEFTNMCALRSRAF